ncbi:probable 18S rRNA (guanine-N(7))-methyltransferase [Littorina saxatilis]|uniref:Methyltransferase type 11 domain-containing protein n=1 Tax=Littorina saxatilis TaxID=31220 RepID=A0AAN9G7D4_9CAEN
MTSATTRFLEFSKTCSMLGSSGKVGASIPKSGTMGTNSFFRLFALYNRDVKQIFFFDNTEEHLLNLEQPYQTVQDIKMLRVRSIKGGFQRRPELIKQRTLDIPFQGSQGNSLVKSYGLFDKCERIQQELTETILKLMNPETEAGRSMLDIGCGHGWSLTLPALKGFDVTGIDLDLQALYVIQDKIRCTYLPERVHVVRTDIVNGICFRENMFDFAISISFLQWLCVKKNSEEKLNKFFCSLSSVLKSGGKAGIQFYPRNVGDVSKVIVTAQKYFKGALVSDFPHIDRGRKLFLVLVNDK